MHRRRASAHDNSKTSTAPARLLEETLRSHELFRENNKSSTSTRSSNPSSSSSSSLSALVGPENSIGFVGAGAKTELSRAALARSEPAFFVGNGTEDTHFGREFPPRERVRAPNPWLFDSFGSADATGSSVFRADPILLDTGVSRNRSDHLVMSGTMLYGYALLLGTFVAFVAGMYMLVLARFMPDTGIFLLDLVKHSPYYAALVPASGIVVFAFVIANWMSLKFFRHN